LVLESFAPPPPQHSPIHRWENHPRSSDTGWFFFCEERRWVAAILASPPPPPHQHQQPHSQPAQHPNDRVGRAEQPARCPGALLHQPLLQQKPAAHQAAVESDRAPHQPAIGPALQPQNHAQQDQPAEASRGPWPAAERRSSANQPRGPPAARRQSGPASEPAPPPCRLTRGQHATSSAGGGEAACSTSAPKEAACPAHRRLVGDPGARPFSSPARPGAGKGHERSDVRRLRLTGLPSG